jgi:hypothetical protein
MMLSDILNVSLTARIKLAQLARLILLKGYYWFKLAFSKIPTLQLLMMLFIMDITLS